MKPLVRWATRCVLLALLALALWVPAAIAQSGFPCRRWLELHPTTKSQLIAGVIEMNRKNGTVLKLPVSYYVRELDQLIGRYATTGNQAALDTSLGFTLHIIAAMEGDYDNGEDPLEHARKFLADWFPTFQQLYPDKHEHLVELSRSRQGTPTPPPESGVTSR